VTGMNDDEPVTSQWKIMKYDRGRIEEREDEVADEFPLTIRVDREEFATIVCSPSDLDDMVIGFLASEGMIRSMDHVSKLTVDTDRGFADVELTVVPQNSKDWYNKRFIGSCCGKSRQFYFHNDVRTAKTIVSRTTITPGQCLSLMRQLQHSSADFRSTGGVHNAALCSMEKLLVARSDIGRHNALDKLYGHCLRHRVPLKDKALVFSGRVSSEVLLKTAKIGIGLLLSKSAPTQLALQLAEDLGITVIGFIRGDSFNVYTHPERLDTVNFGD